MGSLGPTATALLASKVLLLTVSVPDDVLDGATEPTAGRIAKGLVVGQTAIADAEHSAVFDQDAAPRVSPGLR